MDASQLFMPTPAVASLFLIEMSLLAGSLSLGTPTKRDSKKATSGQTQHSAHHQPQRAGGAAPAQGLAAQERQRSAGSSMLTSFFGRFGKSAASTPVRTPPAAGHLVPHKRIC